MPTMHVSWRGHDPFAERFHFDPAAADEHCAAAIAEAAAAVEASRVSAWTAENAADLIRAGSLETAKRELDQTLHAARALKDKAATRATSYLAGELTDEDLEPWEDPEQELADLTEVVDDLQEATSTLSVHPGGCVCVDDAAKRIREEADDALSTLGEGARPKPATWVYLDNDIATLWSRWYGSTVDVDTLIDAAGATWSDVDGWTLAITRDGRVEFTTTHWRAADHSLTLLPVSADQAVILDLADDHQTVTAQTVDKVRAARPDIVAVTVALFRAGCWDREQERLMADVYANDDDFAEDYPCPPLDVLDQVARVWNRLDAGQRTAVLRYAPGWAGTVADLFAVVDTLRPVAA